MIRTQPIPLLKLFLLYHAFWTTCPITYYSANQVFGWYYNLRHVTQWDMLLLVTIMYSILCSHLQQFFTSWKCWSGKSLTFAQFCFLMTVYQNATVMNIFGYSLLFQLITKLRSCIFSWTVIFLLVEIVIHMYIRSFNKFGIKVLWRLQFLEYLRTLRLKFQKARTKIEVVLSLPS